MLLGFAVEVRLIPLALIVLGIVCCLLGAVRLLRAGGEANRSEAIRGGAFGIVAGAAMLAAAFWFFGDASPPMPPE